MTSSQISSRSDHLNRIIVEAGKQALVFANDISELTIERKANAQDVVSRADRDVETYLRAEILRHFPDDGIMGEEHGVQDGSSGFLWVIDPIDGTSPFLSGLTDWCVTIAIQQGDTTVAGAVYDPNKTELFSAVLGAGASLNGRKMELDPGLSLENGNCGVGASHRIPPEPVARFIQLLLSEGGIFFRNGSGALMLADVAAGRLAAYYEPHMNAWDCLAGLLLVREAGGWTLDFPSTGSLAGGGAVAASGPGGVAQLQSLIARSGDHAGDS